MGELFKLVEHERILKGKKQKTKSNKKKFKKTKNKKVNKKNKSKRKTKGGGPFNFITVNPDIIRDPNWNPGWDTNWDSRKLIVNTFADAVMTENNSLTGSLNKKGDKKTIEFIENFKDNFNPDDFKKNNRVILTNLNQSNPEHFEILKKLMVSHFRQNYTAGEQQLRQLAINELITKVFKDKAQSESKFNTRDFISDIAKSFLDGSYKNTDELPNNTIFYTLKTGARIDFFQNKIKNILLKIIQYLKEKEITQQEEEEKKMTHLEKRLTKFRNKDDDDTEAVIEESVRNMDTFKFKIMEIYYEKNIIQFFKLITELLKDDYFLSILIYYDNTEKYNSINDVFNNLTKEIEQRQQRDIENNLRIKLNEEILLRAITKKNMDKLESEKEQIIKNMMKNHN